MLALYHVSDVHFIFQDRRNGRRRPGMKFAAVPVVRDKALAAIADLIIARRHDLHCIQALCNRAGGHSILIPVKYLPHDLRLFLVHDEPVPVSRVLLITERRVVADEFPALPLHGQRALDLDGKLADVIVVDDVGKGYDRAAIPTGVFDAVKVIQDRDHADALLRKIVLHQPPKLRIIAPQAGVILKDDAVDFSAFNVTDQRLITRTFEIAACIPIVRIDGDRLDLFALLPQILQVLLVDAVLVLDAVALRLVSVFLAEPVVFSHAPFRCKMSRFLFLFVLHKGHGFSFLPNK